MRIAVVGPNGSGKSTLLKILLNTEKYDSGRVDIGQSVSIGYLPQEIVEGNDKSIIEEVLHSFPEISKIENEMFALTKEIDRDPSNQKIVNKLSSLQDEFQKLGGWDIEKNAKIILGGLGFKESQFHMPFNSFSGGWRMRFILAGILLRKPNYLFFDVSMIAQKQIIFIYCININVHTYTCKILYICILTKNQIKTRIRAGPAGVKILKVKDSEKSLRRPAPGPILPPTPITQYLSNKQICI